jgi:hypothetical protein
MLKTQFINFVGIYEIQKKQFVSKMNVFILCLNNRVILFFLLIIKKTLGGV